VFDAFDWESFSAAWNSDLKMSFHFVKQAFALPLRRGSTVVMVSSGAAVNGSPLSGEYAGAKRMQWLLAGYAQKQSDERRNICTIAVLPTQLIQGSAIAARASKAYGALAASRPGSTCSVRRFHSPTKKLRRPLSARCGVV